MRELLSTTFSQPLGSQVVDGELRGYYIDFRVKAPAPTWPPPELTPLGQQLHVDVAQWGLGAWERYLAGEGEQWLAAARAVATQLADVQERSGPLAGGWVHRLPYPHTFPLQPPWLSAMAQGEGASLLLRVAAETGDERLREAAALAREPLLRPASEGGVQALLGGEPWLEEYPTDPPSFVLNGAIFALWGCLDLSLGADDRELGELFERGVDTLAANLRRWDLGWWSRYDLFRHPLPNVASEAYHALHVTQLTALDRTAPRPALRETAARWQSYARSRAARARVYAAKVAFRLAVPRNAALARRLPWTRVR